LKGITKDNWPIVANIGFAGPIIENKGKITNLDWPEVVGSDLGKDLGIPKF